MQDLLFTNDNRQSRIGESNATLYDLIVIGGGITGAGIALDASLRGYKTLLVEKQDFASGTSSKSTKLIHGGLRYLKQLEIGLVKESGLERAVAHRNIPHLIHPEKMLLPIVEEGTFGRFTASLAISVYDRLANVPPEDRKKTLSKAQTLQAEPLLNPSLLKSGIVYSEYRTDDARLTIELVKAARREGAEAFNYMLVEDFIYGDDHQIVGVQCRDVLLNNSLQFRAKQVVSAAGPWVDKLREVNKSSSNKSLHLTKGVHVVLPYAKLPLKTAVYFDAFDGRMLFAIPRGNVTYVGTSDTNYDSDLDRVVCTQADAEYLVGSVNTMFEVEEVLTSDIASTWAGLRPLIHEEGKSPSELSRKDEIFISDSNLISIAGGKLTGYRKMARRIVDLVCKRQPDLAQGKCKTRFYKIHSDSFENYAAFLDYKQTLYTEYQSKGFTEYDAWYLTTTYGRHATTIVNTALGHLGQMSLEKALLVAEIHYTIAYESCYWPDDFFNRRSGRLYFAIDSVTKHFDLIVDTFASHYGWNSQTLNQVKTRCQTYIDDVTILA